MAAKLQGPAGMRRWLLRAISSLGLAAFANLSQATDEVDRALEVERQRLLLDARVQAVRSGLQGLNGNGGANEVDFQWFNWPNWANWNNWNNWANWGNWANWFNR